MFKRYFEARVIQIALERVREARPEFNPWPDFPQALHLELRDHEIGALLECELSAYQLLGQVSGEPQFSLAKPLL